MEKGISWGEAMSHTISVGLVQRKLDIHPCDEITLTS